MENRWAAHFEKHKPLPSLFTETEWRDAVVEGLTYIALNTLYQAATADALERIANCLERDTEASASEQ